MARQKSNRQKKARPSARSAKPKFEVRLPPWAADLSAVLGFVVMLGIFFWPVLSGSAYFWEDFLEVFYPMQSYVAGELSAGRFPFWVPYVFGGTPLIAMIDSLVLYPPNWILPLFVDNEYISYLALEYHAVGHVLLFGTGIYFLCREMGTQRPGAFIAGTTALFSGRLIHQMFNVTMLYPYAWAPWCMLFMYRAIERRSWTATAVGGVLLSLTIFGGHIQLAMYIFYGVGILFSVLLISRLRASQRKPMLAARLIGRYGLMNLVAVGLASILLIPAVELVEYSLRADFSYDEITSYSFHPRQIITILIPDFFGTIESSSLTYWGPNIREYGRYWETYHYMGILPLFLAALALFMRRQKTTLAFGILAGVSYVLAFGDSFPLYPLIVDYLPGFNNFRAPARIFFIYSLAMAVLTGMGADTLWRYAKDQTMKPQFKTYLIGMTGFFIFGLIVFAVAGDAITQWLAGSADRAGMAEASLQRHAGQVTLLIIVSLLFLAAWYYSLLQRTVLIGIGALLIYTDLYQAGHDFNISSKDPVAYFATDQIVPFLKERQKAEGGRAVVRSAKSLMGPRNISLLHRIRTLSGYTSPLRIKNNLPPAYAWQLMNVTYYNDYIPDRMRVINDRRFLKPLTDTMPPAFVVRNYVIAENREETAAAMSAPDFDYRTMITLTETPAIDMPADSVRASEMPEVVRNDPNEIDIKVTLDKPAILVLGEVYYPAWVAYVNGERRTVVRANDSMRAIPLEAGSHTIEMRYESDTFRLGAIIALFTLALVCTIIVIDRRKK